MKETLAATETVLIGQAAESYLPTVTREHIRRYLGERTGVSAPGVLLMHRPTIRRKDWCFRFIARTLSPTRPSEGSAGHKLVSASAPRGGGLGQAETCRVLSRCDWRQG